MVADTRPQTISPGSRVFAYFCPPGLDREEVRKRKHVIVFLLIGVVVLFPIGAIHAVEGDSITSGVNLIGGCVFVSMLFSLHFLPKGLVIFRLTAAFLMAILLYNFVVGGQNGSMILWTYAFPAVAFLILGGREGTAWIVVLFATTVVMGMVPLSRLDIYAYPMPMKLRFWVSFPIVAFFSWVIGSFRQEHSEEKQALIERLEGALLEIKTLEGMLPICSYCKKIEDGADGWKSVEHYVRERTDANFTHGICPECMKEHFPNVRLDT